MLRSEMKERMYVRIKDELDNDSFWSRILKGRIFKIDKPAPEPDDSMCWSMTYGTLIMYGMNYMTRESNTIMEPLPPEQQEKMEYIFENKHEFKELFKLGRKYDRKIEALDDMLSDIGVYGFDIYDVSDKNQLVERIQDEMDCIDEDDMDVLDDIVELWVEIEEILEQLTELEDIHVRGIIQKKAI